MSGISKMSYNPFKVGDLVILSKNGAQLWHDFYRCDGVTYGIKPKQILKVTKTWGDSVWVNDRGDSWYHQHFQLYESHLQDTINNLSKILDES